MDTVKLLADFFIDAFQSVFSWPVVVLIIVYWLREPLSRFILTIRSVKLPGGIDVQSRDSAQEPSPGKETVNKPLERDDRPESMTAPSTGPVRLPQRSQFHSDVAQRIKDATDQLGGDAAHREATMIDAFAEKLIALSFERTYRNIFGSQLEAMGKANAAYGVTEVELRNTFERYKETLPEIHGKRTFEQWLGFLRNDGLIQVTPVDGSNSVTLTPAGHDFLRYIVDQHLPVFKPG